MSVSDQASSSPDSTIGELVAKMSEQTTRLVRDEVRLAQAEMAQKGKRMGVGAGLFGAAGCSGFARAGSVDRGGDPRLDVGGCELGRRADGRRSALGDRRGSCPGGQDRVQPGGPAVADRSGTKRQGRRDSGKGGYPLMTDEKTAEPTPDGVNEDPVEAVKADIERRGRACKNR